MTEDMNDIYHFLELDQQKTIFQMFCWRFNDLGLALTRLGSYGSNEFIHLVHTQISRKTNIS